MKCKRGLLSSCASLGLILGTGCGQNITADTTLGELLNQITVGDVVSAFQQFADAAGRGGFGGPQAQLTDEQRAQVEALQAQLDAGEITRDQFIEQVHAIIGDAFPNEPFIGFGAGGGPFHGRFELKVGGYLDLTQEQVDAANAIFDQAHEDITALRTQARADILAVLTDEQHARLDEIVVGLYVGLPLDTARGRGPGGPGGFGFGFGGHGHAFDRFAEALGLTDDQKAQIEAIRTALTDAIRARHEQARTDFLALLTPEQLAKLPGQGSDDVDDDDDDDDNDDGD